MHDIALVNTAHGRTSFQSFPDHHEFFTVCSSCRDTISLPIISATGEQQRVGILSMTLLRRGIPGLGRHGLSRILRLSHRQR